MMLPAVNLNYLSYNALLPLNPLHNQRVKVGGVYRRVRRHS